MIPASHHRELLASYDYQVYLKLLLNTFEFSQNQFTKNLCILFKYVKDAILEKRPGSLSLSRPWTSIEYFRALSETHFMELYITGLFSRLKPIQMFFVFAFLRNPSIFGNPKFDQKWRGVFKVFGPVWYFLKKQILQLKTFENLLRVSRSQMYFGNNS